MRSSGNQERNSAEGSMSCEMIPSFFTMLTIARLSGEYPENSNTRFLPVMAFRPPSIVGIRRPRVTARCPIDCDCVCPTGEVRDEEIYAVSRSAALMHVGVSFIVRTQSTKKNDRENGDTRCTTALPF